MKNNLVLLIVGPTASGKSELAMELAKKINGEVLSADSMLVYKGMDIGTAKPTTKEQCNISHHGMNLISPSKKFSVFTYRQYALKTIKEIVRRGKIPVVCGGTGFYIRALLEGLHSQPAGNAGVRRKLEQEVRKKGLPVLYARLLRMDSRRARQIGPDNGRRIIRALEIYELSGKRPAQPAKKSQGLKALGYEPVVIGIHRDRKALYEQINRRVDMMFRKGLVREVKQLARKKISETACQGVGYKEVLEWLSHDPRNPFHTPDVWNFTHPVCETVKSHGDSKRETLASVKERIKQATRHFAKRQWTWFKREKGIRWVWWPERIPVGKVAMFVQNFIEEK